MKNFQHNLQAEKRGLQVDVISKVQGHTMDLHLPRGQTTTKEAKMVTRATRAKTKQFIEQTPSPISRILSTTVQTQT